MEPYKLPRLFGWLVAAVWLTLAIYIFAPQQLTVTLYKLSLVTAAAVAGYWLDRGLFPYARPDDLMRTPGDGVAGQAMIRRAMVVAACIIGVSLGA